MIITYGIHLPLQKKMAVLFSYPEYPTHIVIATCNILTTVHVNLEEILPLHVLI